MQAGLDRACTDGLDSVLETTNPDNLAMYQHLGWSVRGSTVVDTMTVWVLTHRPSATSLVTSPPAAGTP